MAPNAPLTPRRRAQLPGFGTRPSDILRCVNKSGDVLAVDRIVRTRRAKGAGTIVPIRSGWRACMSKGKDASGRRIRLSADGATKSEAWAKLREKERVHDESPRRGTGHTVETWSEEWLTYLEVARQSASTTIGIYRVRLRHVLPVLGHIRLADLTGADIDRLVRGWAAAGMSPANRKLCFGALRSLLIYAERLGHADIRITLSTYSHSTPARRRAAAEAAGELWQTPLRLVTAS